MCWQKGFERVSERVRNLKSGNGSWIGNQGEAGRLPVGGGIMESGVLLKPRSPAKAEEAQKHNLETYTRGWCFTWTLDSSMHRLWGRMKNVSRKCSPCLMLHNSQHICPINKVDKLQGMEAETESLGGLAIPFLQHIPVGVWFSWAPHAECHLKTNTDHWVRIYLTLATGTWKASEANSNCG